MQEFGIHLVGVMPAYLGQLSTSRVNNFRALRLVAASGVIFSHAFIVNFGLSEATWLREPFYAHTGVSLGELAVNIFFVISGFLVSQSLSHRRIAIDFALSRILRIYPGLFVAVAVCAFVIGPMVTDMAISDYLRNKGTYAYVLYDATALNPFSTRFGLPGIFTSNPYAGVVNASLWTLPWEIWMYISLLGFSGLGLLKKPFPILLAIIYILYGLSEFGLWKPSEAFPIITRFLAFFYTGVALWRYAGLVPISGKLAALLTILFLAGASLTQNRFLEPAYVGYMTLFAAFWRPIVVRRWSNGADISYGIYIYAYPVQQTLVHIMGPHNVYLNMAASFLITACLASASWWLVEKPALGLKASWLRRQELIAGGGMAAGAKPRRAADSITPP